MKQKDFKVIDILVAQSEKILVPWIMIFVNKIDDELKIIQYLQLLLSESMYKKRAQIILTFSSHQEPSK